MTDEPNCSVFPQRPGGNSQEQVFSSGADRGDKLSDDVDWAHSGWLGLNVEYSQNGEFWCCLPVYAIVSVFSKERRWRIFAPRLSRNCRI